MGDIAEMVGGVDAWITASQVNEMDDAGILPVGTPEFSFGSEQIGVKVQTLAGGGVGAAHQLRVKVFGEPGGSAIAVEPKPAIFVDQWSVDAGGQGAWRRFGVHGFQVGHMEGQ